MTMPAEVEEIEEPQVKPDPWESEADTGTQPGNQPNPGAPNRREECVDVNCGQ